VKTFLYPNLKVAGSTMTAKELIDILSTFPCDIPVMVSWEGCSAYLSEYSVERISKGGPDGCDVLLFDANDY
jgi:hypothetical protein